MPPTIIGLFIVGGVIVLVSLLVFARYMNLWLQTMLSGAPIPLIELVVMRFRKVDAKTIVFNHITATKAGLDLTPHQMETHYLAGGRVTNVVRALIAARAANIDLDWDRATAIDLAGRDILHEIQTSIDAQPVGEFRRGSS